MRMQVDPERVTEVCRRYPVGSAEQIRSFGDGHINETFLVESAEGWYICQRLQRKMDPERLKYNYSLYSEVLENAGIRCPKWLPCVDTAEFFYTDEEGERWRMYPYLEGEIPASSLTKETLYACGAGLARFHQALKALPKMPSPVYPMLHDLDFYLEEYRMALGSPEPAAPRDPALEQWIEAESPCFLNLKRGRITVIHGDPKLDNILLQNGAVTAFVDLDTIMPGSAPEDLADLIRSAASAQNTVKSGAVISENPTTEKTTTEQTTTEKTTTEKTTTEKTTTEKTTTEKTTTEKTITEKTTTENSIPEKTIPDPLISDIAHAVLSGYQSVACDALLSPEEIALLPKMVRKLYFELTVRYYTDHLLGGKHFHKKYPGYLLEKARDRCRMAKAII